MRISRKKFRAFFEIFVSRPTLIECRETRPKVNIPVHRWCGERRSPKVQPLTRPGIEPRTFWLAVRDLTNCANVAHTLLYLPHYDKFEMTMSTAFLSSFDQYRFIGKITFIFI